MFFFCPACGMDNRPPHQRQRVAPHTHHAGGFAGRFCVWCGDPIDEPYPISRKTRIALGCTLLGIALLLALAACAVGSAMSNHVGFLTEHLGGWALTTYRTTDDAGRPGTTTYGATAIGYLAVGAILASGYGFRMLRKLPLKIDYND